MSVGLYASLSKWRVNQISKILIHFFVSLSSNGGRLLSVSHCIRMSVFTASAQRVLQLARPRLEDLASSRGFFCAFWCLVSLQSCSSALKLLSGHLDMTIFATVVQWSGGIPSLSWILALWSGGIPSLSWILASWSTRISVLSWILAWSCLGFWLYVYNWDLRSRF